jgi:hypothetical protein
MTEGDGDHGGIFPFMRNPLDEAMLKLDIIQHASMVT